MSEFLESAKRIAAEQAAAEQRSQDEAARQRTKEEADHELSRQRAKGFVKIMRDHNIGMIALCREGDYNRIPPMQWLKTLIVDNAEASQRLRREQDRKITVFEMGWIAARNYTIEYPDGSSTHVHGVFVSDRAETFLYSYQAVSRGIPYVAPANSEKLGRLRGAADEGVLAAHDTVQRVGQMLVEYGIKGETL